MGTVSMAMATPERLVRIFSKWLAPTFDLCTKAGCKYKYIQHGIEKWKEAEMRPKGKQSVFSISLNVLIGSVLFAFVLSTLGISPVSAEASLGTISVGGSNPYAVAVNPITNKIYVANYWQGECGNC